MKTQRAFIAAPLSEEILGRLGELQQQLCAQLPEFRPTAGRNLHLTLNFLDRRSPQELEEISRIMLSIGGQTGSIRALSADLQLLGRKGSKRPLCLGLKAPDALFHLQRRLERQIDSLCGSGPHRSYRPHLTLGRLKPAPGSRLPYALTPEPLELFFDRIGLYSSRLLPQGAEHRLLTEVLLVGNNV